MGKDTAEKLKEKLDDGELAQTIEEVIEEKVEERVQERRKEENENDSSKEKQGISRRSFLKKVGLGAAGIGAASLLPSASALDVRDSTGLSVYQDSTEHLDVSDTAVNVLNTVLQEQGNRVATRNYVDNNTFSGSHDNLSNISSNDHHNRYTDSEAISAVSNSNLTGGLTLGLNAGRGLNLTGSAADSHITRAGSNTLNFVVDSDNNQSSDKFRFYHDGLVGDTSAKNLFTIDSTGAYEQGNRLATRNWSQSGNIAHSDLSDAPSSAHHSKYTDSEAVSAVESGNLSLSNNLQINKSAPRLTLKGDDSGYPQVSYYSNGNKQAALELDASNDELYIKSFLTNTDLLHFDLNTNQVNITGNRVLTTADEGSGNNLDADTVDGQEASELGDEWEFIGSNTGQSPVSVNIPSSYDQYRIDIEATGLDDSTRVAVNLNNDSNSNHSYIEYSGSGNYGNEFPLSQGGNNETIGAGSFYLTPSPNGDIISLDNGLMGSDQDAGNVDTGSFDGNSSLSSIEVRGASYGDNNNGQIHTFRVYGRNFQ